MTARPPRSRSRTILPLSRWLPAGIYGGITGGFGAAWLLWGNPRLLTRPLCILIKAPIAVAVFIGVMTMGCTFVLSGQTLVRGIRRIIEPQPIGMLMYEPEEPIPEMELIRWPHPGCGLLSILPIMLIGGAFSLPWLWFAPRQVPIGWLILSGVIGLPFGLVIARQEAQKVMDNFYAMRR
jgi:hypothetical protein